MDIENYEKTLEKSLEKAKHHETTGIADKYRQERMSPTKLRKNLWPWCTLLKVFRKFLQRLSNVLQKNSHTLRPQEQQTTYNDVTISKNVVDIDGNFAERGFQLVYEEAPKKA